MAGFKALLLFSFFVAFALANGEFGPIVAKAFLRETQDTANLILGEVNFYQKTNTSDVTIFIFAFANEDWFVRNNFYGVHIHEYGDIVPRDASGIGPHFEGLGFARHSCPPDFARHSGDLGNFKTNSNHQLIDRKTVTLVQTYGARGNSIIGRAISIMAFEDVCSDTATPGPAAAFGVIGLAKGGPAGVGISTVEPPPQLLTAHMFGSGECFQCLGDAWLWQEGDVVHFRAKVIAPMNFDKTHGFVLHEAGDITTKTGVLMGNHFGADNNSHGISPPEINSHIGDIGNNQYWVAINPDFVQIWIDTTVSFSMFEAAGRSIAMYERYDHGSNCKDGALGKKWSFGVFGLPSPTSSVPNVPRARRATPIIDLTDCDAGGLDSSAGALSVSLSVVVGVLGYFFL